MNDVGVVVLNYITIEETKAMLSSLKQFYPNVRTVVVDNGSPNGLVIKLKEAIQHYKNVSLITLDKNQGFAKGMNIGIKKLLDEGFIYMCCSNNDIIITESGLLEHLKSKQDATAAAVVGPRVFDIKGFDISPLYDQRPDVNQLRWERENFLTVKGKIVRYIPVEIKFIMEQIILIINIIKKNLIQILPCYLKMKIKRIVSYFMINSVGDRNDNFYHEGANEYNEKPMNDRFVYALDCSFIMMGPTFFKYYYGFDDYTYLYYEEAILAEKLLLKKLKSLYAPAKSVIHKGAITTNLDWGYKAKYVKMNHLHDSFNYYWYNYYNKYDL